MIPAAGRDQFQITNSQLWIMAAPRGLPYFAGFAPLTLVAIM